MAFFSSAGGATTIGSASGGYILAFNNISTVPQTVLGQDPQRRQITFINPGATAVYVAPVYIQNSGSDVLLVPSPTALGGCILVPPGGGFLTLDGECQKPWQAFSTTGTTNPLTIKVGHAV